MTRSTFDVVIVGGGSAGCVLANRLSADPATRVLLLEAGRPDHWWDLLVEMPAAMAYAVGSRTHDWRFESEPEPHLDGRRLVHPRGRVLGGSSSINGVVYQRGHAADYDRWAAEPGMEHWDWAHCLPYFARLENSRNPAAGPSRGRCGPQDLVPAPLANPLFDAFLGAAREAGYAVTGDVNEEQEAFGAFDRAVRRGRRVSAAKAYLNPVRRRPNLFVRCESHVTKVVFEGRRAVGVRFREAGGPEIDVHAGEVILSAGAIQTPQILQLSGVGEAGHLSGLGIDPVLDLPAVGRGMQDHLGIHLQNRCTQPVSMMTMRHRHRWPVIGLQWLVAGRGPGASSQIEAGGFVRTDPSLEHPDLMLAFAPIATRTDPASVVDEHGYQLYLMAARPESRGTVTLRTGDPTDAPSIRFNYLSTQAERDWWPRAIRVARDLLDRPAFAPYDGGETVPGRGLSTDEELLGWVQASGRTGLHPTSSCRMGTGDDAVVDPSTMGVHGLDGLRVVDASVMPSIVNANTYAPVMMIAEKAADMILGATPPAPAPTGSDARG
ncbi:choline dehydrogenase [Pseudonocardia petroleophila]|uniref:Choline dehydrogenase n=1 Tax=Pseudonocardia petroleophila TaxID=37331 RepID=A0A7G7MQL1_9PSEU|nr:choline dehydrogenase [Pseudonocardia petroleophila]QNG55072.1 choline dehydrogenase [Pseudonocardia petroleophila]